MNETYIQVNDSQTFGSYTVSSNASNVTVGLTSFTGVKQVCTESWYFTGSYGACSAGSKPLIYADANSCGTTHVMPSSTTTVDCTQPSTGGGSSGGGSSSSGFIIPPPTPDTDDETPDENTNVPVVNETETPVIINPDPRPSVPVDNNQNTSTPQETDDEGFWSSFNIGALLVSTNALVAYLTVFVLMGVVGAVFVVRQHTEQTVKPPVMVKLADDPYPQLTDYVKRELEKGISEKRLRLFLLKTEWNAADIDRAFEKANKRQY